MRVEAPAPLFDFLDGFYHFDVHVCAPPQTAGCREFWTKDADGLTQTWERGKGWSRNPRRPCRTQRAPAGTCAAVDRFSELNHSALLGTTKCSIRSRKRRRRAISRMATMAIWAMSLMSSRCLRTREGVFAKAEWLLRRRGRPIAHLSGSAIRRCAPWAS